MHAEEGLARFEGWTDEYHYNPMGTVHGGWSATLLDSAMGSAVMSTMDSNSAYTTMDFTVHLVRTRINPDLQILGIVPTFVNLRTRFSRQLLEGLCELASIKVFDTAIAPTVKLQETALVGVPVIAYAPSSKAADAYRRLAGEVLASV